MTRKTKTEMNDKECRLHSELINEQIRNISNIMSALKTELKAEISSKDDLITLQLKQILTEVTNKLSLIISEQGQIKEQVTKTNGRVTTLEDKTKVWTFFQERPILGISALTGIFAIAYKGLTFGLDKLLLLVK